MKKLLILIVSIIFFTCSNSSDPDPDPTIYLSPSSSNISIGGQTDLNIVIEDNDKSVFGISMQIVFENSSLGFTDSSGFSAGAMFDQNAISFVQSNGSIIHLSLTKVNDPFINVELSSSGKVGTLTFQANVAGNSIVSILGDELYFYDSNGEEITISDLSIESASINVQ